MIDALTATATRRQQAEGRLAVIRNALTMADEELARVKAERDWEVFGLGSFTEYCDQMLPDLKFIKLRAPERLNRIKALLAADPNTTEREAAASTGSSAATAHRDFLKATGRSASNEAREFAQPAPSPVPTYVQAARAIGACGPGGGSTPDVMSRLGWEQGRASVAVSRAAKRGLLVSTGERAHVAGASPGFALYVAVTR